MSDEWSRYKKFLDREDEDFERVMEVEVSTSLFSKFSSKYKIVAGINIIAQNPIDFATFKQCLAPLPCRL